MQANPNGCRIGLFLSMMDFNVFDRVAIDEFDINNARRLNFVETKEKIASL